MTIESYIALGSTIIALGGLLLINRQIRKATEQNKLLAEQIRESTKQQERQSFVEIYDKNRKLVSLGFSHPSLFAILDDAENIDPVWERRYLQLWLNHFALTQRHLKEAIFKDELKESLIRDISDFMSLKNMRRHWSRYGTFYPASFQKLVNDIIRQNEPPHPDTAAQLDSGR
jgi:hypothetical protein